MKIALFVVLGIIALFVAVSLLFWIIFIILSLTINKNKEYENISPFYNFFFILAYRYLTRASGARIHVTGLENVPKDQRYMLISNHRSRFDNFCHIVTLRPENLAYISKPENFAIPFVGHFMKRGLYISINRGNPKDGLLSILRGTELIKNNICSVGVFPEGTRSKDLKLNEFKPGCFKIATKAKCPIVVCCTQGTEKIHKNFPLKRTDVYLDFIKVIYPDEINEMSTVEIGEYVQKLIQNKLDETGE